MEILLNSAKGCAEAKLSASREQSSFSSQYDSSTF